jgi:hypothetical protein
MKDTTGYKLQVQMTSHRLKPGGDSTLKSQIILSVILETSPYNRSKYRVLK